MDRTLGTHGLDNKTLHFELSPFKMLTIRTAINPTQYNDKSVHRMGGLDLGAKAKWPRRKDKI